MNAPPGHPRLPLVPGQRSRSSAANAKTVIEDPANRKLVSIATLLGDRHQGRTRESWTSEKPATTFLPSGTCSRTSFDLLGIELRARDLRRNVASITIATRSTAS